MRNLIVLVTALFTSASMAEVIPGGQGGAADFPSGFTVNSGTTLDTYEEATYTPTFSGFASQVTNVDTPTVFHYQRIGKFVEVIGTALIDQGGAGEGSFLISLPIASDLSLGGDASGLCGISDAGFKKTGFVVANTGSDLVQCQIETGSANSNRLVTIKFRYVVQ